MSESDSRSNQRFFCQSKGKVEGPFDLVEMAGLLRESAIDGDTRVCEEGAEEWRPLRECPEFVLLHEISIEEIARHLLKKERGRSSVESVSKSSFPFTGVIIGAVLLVVAIGWSKSHWLASLIPGLSPAEPEVIWSEVSGDHFSIKSPVSLARVKNSNSEAASYRGLSNVAVFGLDISPLPARANGDFERVLDDLKKDFLLEIKRMAPTGDFRVVSEQRINGDGYQGWELSCEMSVNSTVVESSRVRFVFGKGNVIVLWALVKTGKFKPEDVERFLTSLEVR